MKVVILAGGFGSRLSEETNLLPKPMINIGNFPILYHIMQIYSFYGLNDFIILSGYKSEVIKNYFLNLNIHLNDFSIDYKSGELTILGSNKNNWKVSVLFTGENSQTGSRISYAQKFVGDQFLLTYGDGLSNINIKKLIDFHNSHKKIATLSSVLPDSSFGLFESDEEGTVKTFIEKPKSKNRVNGGFYVLNSEIFNYINGKSSQVILEKDVLPELAKKATLKEYKHDGFWKCMDTLRDKIDLEKILNDKGPIWKK